MTKQYSIDPSCEVPDELDDDFDDDNEYDEDDVCMDDAPW